MTLHDDSGWILVFILLLIFFFSGDPDVWDASRAYLETMKQ